MRKVTFAALIVSSLFVACKKDRTCNCTVTKTGTSTTTAALLISVPPFGNIPVVDTSFVTPVNETQTFDRSLTKVTKSQAKGNCISYTEPYNERTLNEAPPLQLTTTAKGERVYDCELK
jgi:hypothetical protein